MKCAVCHESLRGKRAVAFAGKALCVAPCGLLTKVKTPFLWGDAWVTGAELIRMFVFETSLWKGCQ